MAEQPLNQPIDRISEQVSHALHDWVQSAGLSAIGLPQKDFAAAAKDALQYADTNHDGILTREEIKNAIDHPDPREPHRDDLALHIMDGNWDLLSGAQPERSWRHPFASNITPEAIDKMQAALDGSGTLASEKPNYERDGLAGGLLGMGIGYVADKWHHNTEEKELDHLRKDLSIEGQPIRGLAKEFLNFEEHKAKGYVDGFKQQLGEKAINWEQHQLDR